MKNKKFEQERKFQPFFCKKMAGLLLQFSPTPISTIINDGIKVIPRYVNKIPQIPSVNDVNNYVLSLSTLQIAISLLICTVILYFIFAKMTTFLFGPANYRNANVFINDFVVFKKFAEEWSVELDVWKQRQTNIFNHTAEAVEFTHKLIARSGLTLGKQHVSPGVACDPPDLTIASARYEAETTMFSCVEELISKNNIAPRDVDILVVNCSLFNPTPSLCAMIINKFKFREDIITYNLSGMGCSASPLSIQLASHNLRLHHKPHPLAIVVSVEVLAAHLYNGSEREFLLSNALFRVNGAAVLLSRDSGSVLGRPAPKWRIDNLERVHLGASDQAFQAIHLDNDKDNFLGVRLSKDLIKEAARGVAMNLAILGPKILPYRELLRTAIRMGWRMVKNSIIPPVRNAVETPKPPSKQSVSDQKNKNITTNNGNGDGNTKDHSNNDADDNETNNTRRSDRNGGEKPIVPNFRTCVDYWLIHAGGKAVITGIKDSLNLTENDVKESRDVLFKYGNTSSASIWYELDEVEANRKIKNGQKALAIAIGSGIKVQSMYLTSVNRK